MPPAAPPANVTALCQLIVRSRLMTGDELKAASQRWLQEIPPAQREETELFRRYLVNHRHLTEYQSQMLLRGHVDGFFLDQFRIQDRIGKGRMTGVYRGLAPDGQAVAIKVLPPSKAKDPNLLGRFQREAKLVMQLNHPNIVRAVAVGEAGGLHYIAMEYLEGDTLQEVLERRKRLTGPEAVRIIYQVLQGLQHVYDRGMVHRDIKPSNIILISHTSNSPADTTLHSTAKILDIGLGKATFDEDEDGDKPKEQQLTADGVLLGTPDYLAPEQARSATNVDIRADLYSVGCVMYHLLTGQPPFPDANVLSQVLRHATETPKPLSEFIPGVPDGVQQVVSVLLAKDPNQRFPTPISAAHALKPLLNQPPDGTEASMAAYMVWLEGGEKRPNTAHIYGPKPVSGDQLTDEIPTGKLADRGKKREPEPVKRRKGDKVPSVPAEDIDVELVAIPPPPPSDEDRPLTEFNRRDIIMLSAGGGGVLLAIIIGMLLASLFKKRDPLANPDGENPPAIEQPAQ